MDRISCLLAIAQRNWLAQPCEGRWFDFNVAEFGICTQVGSAIEEPSLSHGSSQPGRFVAVASILLALLVGVRGLVYAVACFQYLFIVTRNKLRHKVDSPILELGDGWFKYRSLLLAVAILVTYIAPIGVNPSGGFGRVSCRQQTKNKQRLTEKNRHDGATVRMTRILASAWHTLKNLLKAIGISPEGQAASPSRESESTSMGSYRDAEPNNTRVAKHNDVNGIAETAATWTVETAEIHHMTGNRNLLSNFKTTEDRPYMTVCSGMLMQVMGRGSVITEKVVLGDVWYVPGLQRNVISVSQLVELGCTLQMKRDACCIVCATDDTIIGNAPVTENGMFKLEFLKVPLVN